MGILSLLFSVSLFASTDHEGILGDNFYEIDKGNYYRSAQLTDKKLEKYVKKYGIKTLINLRGISKKKWYKKQVAMVEKLGIVQYDIKMSAKRLPHRDDLLELLHLFENVERPFLVHCQGGADRTGEASAIYQMLYMNKSKKESLKMLTLKYHHLEWRMPAKRYFIKKLWQGVDWAFDSYDPCSNEWKHYDRERYCN